MSEEINNIYDLLKNGPVGPGHSEMMDKVKDDIELSEEYISVKNTVALVSLRSRPTDREEGKKNYVHFQKKMRGLRIRRLAMRFTAAAAVIAVVLSAGWMYASYSAYRSMENLVNVFEVPAGQRAIVTLNDGTRVQLNARSILEYPSVFNKNSRDVVLHGEGFFEVAKDGKRPFTVSTSDVNVKVLGTHFDVMAYKNKNHEVSVLEGSVEVSVKDGSEKMILLPGNTVTHQDGRLRMTLFDDDDGFMWTKGLYAFASTDFATIIERLSFYYDVNIELRNEKLADIIYTGKFRQTDGAMEILKVIQTIHGFSVRKASDGSIIIE